MITCLPQACSRVGGGPGLRKPSLPRARCSHGGDERGGKSVRHRTLVLCGSAGQISRGGDWAQRSMGPRCPWGEVGSPPALGHTAAVLAEPDGVALAHLDALSIRDGPARASQVAALGYGCCLYGGVAGGRSPGREARPRPPSRAAAGTPDRAHALRESSLLRRLERGHEIGLQAMQETKALISR